MCDHGFRCGHRTAVQQFGGTGYCLYEFDLWRWEHAELVRDAQ